LFPDEAGWTRTDMLLASAVDALHWLQWVKTKDGAKNRNRPKPIPRPGYIEKPRKGAKPKPTPLSKIKTLFTQRNNPDRVDKLNELFAGR
jgi:Family of unknown function (DUF5361)